MTARIPRSLNGTELIAQLISEEIRKLHCSILMDEVKEKIQKLKSYGIKDGDIERMLHGEAVLPRLVITKDFDVVLVGEQRTTVCMEPLVKAVYLLFLSHPEGIILKHLSDYRDELTAFYLMLRPTGMTKRVAKSIEHVTNPTQNSIHEKCARIRRIFLDLLPESIAQYYYVSGKRGDFKRIELPRTSMVWEGNQTKKHHQSGHKQQ